jgi:hypothetical protein
VSRPRLLIELPIVADGRLLRAVRNAELDARNAKLLLAMARESPRPLERPKPGSLPRDPQALRGLPAVGGRGSIGGAIRGTRPEGCIDRLDRQRTSRQGGWIADGSPRRATDSALAASLPGANES